MNKASLKSYAPQARKDFIAAVTARANLLGLSDKAGKLEVAASQPQGDVTVIAGQAWPVKVHSQRDQLVTRIKRDGFAQTMEVVAYTWFNRFAALRYMELHGYLDHGHRALSSSEGSLPDILTFASNLAESGELPGLKPALVTEMKLAGNRDGELYRLLLVAQCNALSAVMPFLFERIDDETELLLPDNLLRTDSVIAKLVAAIEEEDWKEVEIIGWLYQFYISEKKDEVIGKVVESEDIPAATQLFTPNWIVQYLVQNSVGRLWLMANPASILQAQWPYYIEPAQQTPEVQAQLDALIQTRLDEDGGSLSPESITVLDPACGSGHILVVAYDVLKAIYLERGYLPRVIPRLILEKNLYGLDIDDRAAQMAGFALLMKARADDRRLFTATDDAGNQQPPKLNVLSLQESNGLSIDELANHLAPFKVQRATITALVDTFEHAKTFGSLIQIPYVLKTHLALLQEILTLVKIEGDMYAGAAAADLLTLVLQAQLLAMQFDAVLANPPYMGGRYHTPLLKKFSKSNFPETKSDLFSISTERFLGFAKPNGFVALMTPFTWMFLKSYESLRNLLLDTKTFHSLIQPEYHAIWSSAAVPVCTFVIQSGSIKGYSASFIRLTEFYGESIQSEKTLEAIRNPSCGWMYNSIPEDFKRIPGSPLAYWVGEPMRNLFASCADMSSVCEVQAGMLTTDNDRFLRYWWEVSCRAIKWDAIDSESAQTSGCRWFPHNKGGDFRKWWGNQDYVVDWENNGERIKATVDEKYPYLNGNTNFVVHDDGYHFLPSVSWSEITSSVTAFRAYPKGFTFNYKGMSAFAKADCSVEQIISLCNSKLVAYLCKVVNPTLSFGVGNFRSLPAAFLENEEIETTTRKLIEIAKNDWNAFERSWDFQVPPIILYSSKDIFKLELSYQKWINKNSESTLEMKRIEEDNNSQFIAAYGLENEITPDVPMEQVTLSVNPNFRYEGKLTEGDQKIRFRKDTAVELLSYAIGCMMGRYSLDESGMVYAHAGNVGFEPDRYTIFPADTDGIVPITDELWFEDDACSRIREFLRSVWGQDTLAENMVWLAESLGTKASETPDETIRRYLADKFYKDHLQTYKKRPIHWLFSSGKQGAFQALVYLHRYHEGTLARLRAEYVVPLTGKIQSRIDMLRKDAEAASSTAARNKLAKEVEKLKKKHVELLAYDEQLRHYADMRITLDLDDGVKVNYGKFGDLLAEVKAVTGGAGDD